MSDGIEVYDGDGHCPAIDALVKREESVQARETAVAAREAAALHRELDVSRRELDVSAKERNAPADSKRIDELVEMFRRLCERQQGQPTQPWQVTPANPWVQPHNPLFPGPYEAPQWTTGVPPLITTQSMAKDDSLAKGPAMLTADDHTFIARMVAEHASAVPTTKTVRREIVYRDVDQIGQLMDRIAKS